MCDRYRVIFANVGKTIFDALLMTFNSLGEFRIVESWEVRCENYVVLLIT